MNLERRVFYLIRPRWLVKRLMGAAILILFGVTTLSLFYLYLTHLAVPPSLKGLIGSVQIIGIADICGGLFLAANAGVKLRIAARKPFLTLNESNLTLWGLSFPWNIVSGVAPIKLDSGATRLGIVLKGKVVVRPLPGNLVPINYGTKWLQNDLAKYGAIPIPPLRGISAEDLEPLIRGYLSESNDQR